MSDLKTASSIVPAARQEGDALVVRIHGDIDLNNSPELRTAIMGLLGQTSPKRLIMNLGQVTYMDSSAIAVLVELLRKLKGGKIILADLQPRVKGLIEIARLNSIFGIVKTEEEGLALK